MWHTLVDLFAHEVPWCHRDTANAISIENGRLEVVECGGDEDGIGCFADGQLVTVSSGESVPIQAVSVGDRILAADPEDPSQVLFSPVTWIMEHRAPKRTLRIMLEYAGTRMSPSSPFSPAEKKNKAPAPQAQHNTHAHHTAGEMAETASVLVTPQHLMMVEGRGTIDAKDVQVGDTMWIHRSQVPGSSTQRQQQQSHLGTVRGTERIQQAQHVRLVLTEAGTIVVNDVLASSLESSGSSVVKQLLDVGHALGGGMGSQVVRSLTYALGWLVTSGDAQQVASPVEPAVQAAAA